MAVCAAAAVDDVAAADTEAVSASAVAIDSDYMTDAYVTHC